MAGTRLENAGKRERLSFLFALGLTTLGVGGCRVSETDVKRWETTQHGPQKLVAVITHDKYPVELRTEASMSLIRMPARGGVRQGIKYLIERYKDEDGSEREGALPQVPEPQRSEIIDRLVPLLGEELKAPPPAHVDGRVPADPSIPFKDAAFALLTHEPPLVANEKTKADLKAALMKWSQAGFEDRIENASQQYGLEQMMRALGAESVKQLPGLVNENMARIDRVATLVKEVGDDATKLALSNAFVKLADTYHSKEWLDAQTKTVKEYNAKNNVKTDDKGVASQVDKIQEKRLAEELFPAMKKIGLKPSIDYLVKYSGDSTRPDSRRKLALAALEGNLDKNNQADLDRIFAIAKNNDTPDEVRDQAFRRMGEFPKDWILARLYQLSDPPKWKVRWVAFDVALTTMTLKQIPDFMSHLPKGPATKMGQTEPLTYSQRIKAMEGDPKAHLDTITPFLTSKDLGPKLTAIGYFWQGKKEDKHFVQPLEGDASPLPKCEAADECKWECDVPKASDPKDTEPKELKTVGEWVRFCVLPNMEK